MMMFQKGMVEVYLTNDTALYGLIQYELNNRNISYEVKSVNSGTQNRITGTFLGHVGEKKNIGNMYYIYTAKENVECVKKIISEIINYYKK